ncbi:aldehyde dehydrogenase [Aromatoleum aromaticum]|uniref:Putative 4-isopropylbenzaldehyde dehydrogenase n=1 Tax=Aromatoleum aromaticum TaxID=551760 RepID=A0A096ZNZ3_9RHOO|nr:aldehyde dehydrogenase [Aromatoleum aromaticum]AIS23699.2 putative 4-isopropylbenzaldehyde dehydrogenase [Aromatoleum aromaticum]NMG55504.1 aldehyde dehydrogenase family protein [Aromatoleum aromaticum]
MNSNKQSFFIDGEWQEPASSARIEVINATTEEVIGVVPEGREADIDRAVAAARRALQSPSWGGLSPAERSKAMLRFADAIEKRGPELARSVSMQNGMPINVADQLESGFVVAMLRYYAALAKDMVVEESRPSPMGFTSLVRREPVGVVGAIVPWNFPVALSMMKIGPALAAGCTIVLKPSPGTVLDSYILADAAEEAQLPAGVVNWVPGGRELGAYLVTHPGIDKVAFTGSTAAGRIIAQECGRLLRPVTLELGGKSAAIVLEDADLGALVQGLPTASVLNNGQACFSCTRILAPASRYDEVVEAVAGAVSALVVGDPLERTTQIGPMASAIHRDRVQGYVEKGKGEARLVAGGSKVDRERGWFVQPTVFADVDNSATIAREEIFGPVLAIIRYDGEDDAVRIANESEYGLGGTIWSTDRAHAAELARRIDTGTLGINGYMPDLNAPFGGIKASGLGRELGPESVAGYQRYKSIYQLG